jgi:hypothetical protein
MPQNVLSIKKVVSLCMTIKLNKYMTGTRRIFAGKKKYNIQNVNSQFFCE